MQFLIVSIHWYVNDSTIKNYYDLLNDFEKLILNNNSNAKQTKITQFSIISINVLI